ncbi:SDR family oxidoreductase [Chitinophaga sp. LS1]|uniref:SDR family oxidoreductase n=1 Tax=Chitinophaga sp. LS1 TaxID=3051176 RepID=UPI002AAAC7E5|nr:SDR family oxidoreductase [Chitinophaga sp. LS1]WPV64755.1 SDR family oxidoreductase [Chitinophaga sp. LS1]
MNKTILITGASAGIGKAAAQYFAAKSWNVIATMRSPEKETELTTLNNVFVTRLDVQEKESMQPVIAEGIKRFGKIDVLLNNAGYGLFGPFELATDAQIKQQFDVNVFGVMNLTKAILPHFRANKAGTVINVSSIGGRITYPIVSMYHATKFAVEGFSESLAYELAALNIKVKLVEPGAIATGFDTAANFTGNPEITDYDAFVQGFLNLWGSKTMERTTATQVAEVIYEAATDGTSRLRYLAGEDAKAFMQVRMSGEEGYHDYMQEHWVPKNV